MRIAIIGTRGIPNRYGGFESLVENLVKHDYKNLISYVYCSYKNKKDGDEQLFTKIKLIYIPFDANGISSLAYDIISCLHAVLILKSKYLLIFGVSGALIFPILKLFNSDIKIIVNVDGIEWRRQKWNKIASQFLRLSENIAVKYSNVVITDNLVIQRYVNIKYNKKSYLIEYGGDTTTDAPIATKLEQLPELFAIKVSRIEPENNIHIVLSAFSNSKMDLIIIGNWDSSEYGRKLFNKYQNIQNIRLLNPIYDQTVLNYYRNKSSIYIHGHSAGGTNPSLVEAMWLGLPILAFDVSFNRATTENKALYFKTEIDLQNIVNNIDKYNLAEYSKKMKEIANRRYTWEKISQKYFSLLEK